MKTDVPPTRQCPKCNQVVFASAVRCQFCQALLDPTVRLPQAVSDDGKPMNANEKIFLACSAVVMIMGVIRIVVGTGLGNSPSWGTLTLGIGWVAFAYFMTTRNQFIRDNIVWFASFGLVFDVVGLLSYQLIRVVYHPALATGVLVASLLEGSAFTFLLVKRDEWL
ncbi:MAG: hypothetical protein WCK51_10600 [Armatimonadota bacterium]